MEDVLIKLYGQMIGIIREINRAKKKADLDADAIQERDRLEELIGRLERLDKIRDALESELI